MGRGQLVVVVIVKFGARGLGHKTSHLSKGFCSQHVPCTTGCAGCGAGTGTGQKRMHTHTHRWSAEMVITGCVGTQRVRVGGMGGPSLRCVCVWTVTVGGRGVGGGGGERHNLPVTKENHLQPRRHGTEDHNVQHEFGHVVSMLDDERGDRGPASIACHSTKRNHHGDTNTHGALCVVCTSTCAPTTTHQWGSSWTPLLWRFPADGPETSGPPAWRARSQKRAVQLHQCTAL